MVTRLPLSAVRGAALGPPLHGGRPSGDDEHGAHGEHEPYDQPNGVGVGEEGEGHLDDDEDGNGQAEAAVGGLVIGSGHPASLVDRSRQRPARCLAMPATLSAS